MNLKYFVTENEKRIELLGKEQQSQKQRHRERKKHKYQIRNEGLGSRKSDYAENRERNYDKPTIIRHQITRFIIYETRLSLSWGLPFERYFVGL